MLSRKYRKFLLKRAVFKNYLRAECEIIFKKAISKKNDTNELIYETETDPQTQKTNLWFTKAGKGG